GTSVVSSSFELLFQLVEDSPVGALGEDLLRARLDHAGLVKPERVEPERVRRVDLAPSRPRDLLQRLQDVILPHREPTLTERPCRAGRLERTPLLSLQDRSKRALERDGVACGELAVRGEHAAEVLRPRTVHRAVHHDVSDLLLAQLLRVRWKAEIAVDLA